MHLDRRALVLTGLSIFALLGAACSAPTPNAKKEADTMRVDPAAGDLPKAPKGGKGDPLPTPPATSPAPLPKPAETCAASGNAATCRKCCIDQGRVAYDASMDVFEACVCKTTDTCKTECGDSFCNGQTPSDACTQCVAAKGEPCFDQASATCQANATCKVVDECLTTTCAPLDR